MEQKRTIWIVLAAGIFLLVVLGAALILYAPEAKKNTTALYQRDSGSIWMSPEAAEYKKADPYADGIKLPPEPFRSDSAMLPPGGETVPAEKEADSLMPGPEEKTDGDVTVIASESRNVYNAPDSSSTTIDLNALKSAPSSGSENVTAQNRAAENAIRETNAVHRNVEKSEVLVEKKYTAPKPAVSAAKPAASSPAPKKTVSVPAPAKRAADRFWVQAGSYTTTKNADEARSVLESNKIPCEVFTFTDAKGILHYRVRVGPYVTKSEAEYWKKRIDSISLFAGNSSYITNTSAAK